MMIMRRAITILRTKAFSIEVHPLILALPSLILHTNIKQRLHYLNKAILLV
jgi:hypothetical protein